MKLWKLILIIGIFSLAAGCSDSDLLEGNSTIYAALGFIYQDINDDYFIITDYSDTLEIVYSYDNIDFPDSSRVLTYYGIEEKLASSEDHFSVIINRIDRIIYKDVIDFDESISDSLGNDPIEILSIWQTGVNLNIEFAFYGGDQMHAINLTKPTGNVDELSSPLELTFRHNANNDGLMIAMKSIITFNLEKLQSSISDTTKYKIISTDYDGNNNTHNGMVVFN